MLPHLRRGSARENCRQPSRNGGRWGQPPSEKALRGLAWRRPAEARRRVALLQRHTRNVFCRRAASRTGPTFGAAVVGLPARRCEQVQRARGALQRRAGDSPLSAQRSAAGNTEVLSTSLYILAGGPPSRTTSSVRVLSCSPPRKLNRPG